MGVPEPADVHPAATHRPHRVGSRFGNWLLLKVLLAFGVLGVFVNAMWAMRRGAMNVCRFRHTHRIVLALMVGIVFLAKTMFYL